MPRLEMRGRISSAGFASGDRFVLGDWWVSPIGAFADVMWARPDGERVLLASSSEAAELVTTIYRFDRCQVVGMTVADEPREVRAEAGQVALRLVGAAGWRLPGGRRRPAAWHRLVEAPVARLVLGVQVYGTSPAGVREWYRADEWRPVVAASASVAGEGLGELRPLDPPCGFGFSEPPRRPSLVRVRPLLEDPSGRLGELAARHLHRDEPLSPMHAS